MQKKILKNKKHLLFIGILVFLLVLVRFFESKLFYDPFLTFFKSEFQNQPLPEYNGFGLYSNIFFRYLVNTIVSLGIIHLLFNDLSITKFTTILYIAFFLVLIIFFALILNFSNDYLLLFYIRRFLIQPLFLILFIPAFYYQKMNK